jgi:hypothetical protein
MLGRIQHSILNGAALPFPPRVHPTGDRHVPHFGAQLSKSPLAQLGQLILGEIESYPPLCPIHRCDRDRHGTLIIPIGRFHAGVLLRRAAETISKPFKINKSCSCNMRYEKSGT